MAKPGPADRIWRTTAQLGRKRRSPHLIPASRPGSPLNVGGDLQPGHRSVGDAAGFGRAGIEGFPLISPLYHFANNRPSSMANARSPSVSAWEELGRPNFDSVYYARFKPQNNAQITLLDFGYRPALMAAMIDADQAACSVQSPKADFAVAQAVCWPLLAASSIRRRFEDCAVFIAEYIVPQLILQWITNSGNHDGIRYFSVRVDTYMNNPAMACNYVFPAKQFAPAGHCATLRGKLEMSPPLSWQIVERTGMPAGLAAGMPVHGNSAIALVPGYTMQYVQTPFGQIEAKSLAYPCATF